MTSLEVKVHNFVQLSINCSQVIVVCLDACDLCHYIGVGWFKDIGVGWFKMTAKSSSTKAIEFENFL